jgi:3D (Asp-Asp-Asp) domain-containing protein
MLSTEQRKYMFVNGTWRCDMARPDGPTPPPQTPEHVLSLNQQAINRRLHDATMLAAAMTRSRDRWRLLAEALLIVLTFLAMAMIVRGCSPIPDSFGAMGSDQRSAVSERLNADSRGLTAFSTTEADARRGTEGHFLPSFSPARSDCSAVSGQRSAFSGQMLETSERLNADRRVQNAFPVMGHSIRAIASVGTVPTNRIDGRRRDVAITPPPSNGLEKKVSGSLEPVAGEDASAFQLTTDYQPLTTTPFEITAYEPSPVSCGRWADGFTASGLPVTHNGGRFVAADRRVLPFGSLVRIPGYANGAAVPVIDVGGAIRGNRIDVFFPTLAEARRWGRRKNVPVQVVRIGWAKEQVASSR